MPVTRFAPSPSGWLHLGHALAAWEAHRAAAGGLFHLRMEDIDGARCQPQYETAICEDLTWLGLTWALPVWRQSERLSTYQSALDRLSARGLLYPCFCTRADISHATSAPQGPVSPGPEGALYPGTCRDLSAADSADRIAAGHTYALRLHMAAAMHQVHGAPLQWHDAYAGWQPARPELHGDVVLARKGLATSYHLAVTVDDAAQAISLVTRGEDLFSATHVHRLLQALLDLPVPQWAHHRLICDADGRRLAKRNAARSLRSLRAEGHTPQSLRALCGLGPADGCA